MKLLNISEVNLSEGSANKLNLKQLSKEVVVKTSVLQRTHVH